MKLVAGRTTATILGFTCLRASTVNGSVENDSLLQMGRYIHWVFSYSRVCIILVTSMSVRTDFGIDDMNLETLTDSSKVRKVGKESN